MKNSKKVLELLVSGKSRPCEDNADQTRIFLEGLLNTGDKEGNDGVASDLTVMIRDQVSDPGDVATMVQALIIGLPASLLFIFEKAHDSEFLSKWAHAEHPFLPGFMVGWIEAAVWLQMEGQIAGDADIQFVRRLGLYIRSLITRRGLDRPVGMDSRLLGRLANVSTPFVEKFKCGLLFRDVRDDGSFQLATLESGYSIKSAPLEVVNELSIKALLRAQLHDRLHYLVAGGYDGVLPKPAKG